MGSGAASDARETDRDGFSDTEALIGGRKNEGRVEERLEEGFLVDGNSSCRKGEDTVDDAIFGFRLD